MTKGSLIGESECNPLPLTVIELTISTSLSDMQTVATSWTSCRACVGLVIKLPRTIGSGARGKTRSAALKSAGWRQRPGLERLTYTPESQGVLACSL